MKHKNPDDNSILVLSYLHEGGEWIATRRLLQETGKKFGVRFYLVGLYDNTPVNKAFFEETILVKMAGAHPPFSFFKKIFSDLKQLRSACIEIQKRMGNRSIECIFVTHYLMIFPIFTLKNLRGKKIIFYFHGVKSITFWKLSDIDYRKLIINFLERLALTLSKIIITCSAFAEDYVKSFIIFNKNKNFYIVPNGLPPEFFTGNNKTKKIRSKLQIDSRKRLILYSGRIAKYKGLENLIQASRLIAHLYPKLLFIIAYPSGSADRLFLKRLKINTKISSLKFIEDLDSQDLIALYRESDVLILPSEIEMASLAVIEALSQGLPVISTPTGNTVEILSKIDPRLILNNSSAEEIISKLEYFLNLPQQKILKLKIKCRQTAKVYSISKSAQNLAKIFVSEGIINLR